MLLEVQEPTDFTIQPVLRIGNKEPLLLKEGEFVQMHELIGEKDTPCFSITRYNCTGGSATLTTGAAVYIVTSGGGTGGCGLQQMAPGMQLLLSAL